MSNCFVCQHNYCSYPLRADCIAANTYLLQKVGAPNICCWKLKFARHKLDITQLICKEDSAVHKNPQVYKGNILCAVCGNSWRGWFTQDKRHPKPREVPLGSADVTPAGFEIFAEEQSFSRWTTWADCASTQPEAEEEEGLLTCTDS